MNNTARVEHRDQLSEALEQRLATRSAREWAAELTEVRVPAGVVNDIAGAFEPRPGARARAGRRDSAGGRDDRGAHPQSDPPVGDAADVPLGAAAARGAEAAR